MSSPATVAIVGRPNVGKSTIFNRLLGERKAIVHDQPGVTRDRITGAATFDGRPVDLIDTGGLVPGDDPLGLNRQVRFAAEESDLLLFVVDGREGRVAADERIWEELRRLDKPTILVVNKADTKAAVAGFDEFYALGLERQLLVSAEHGLGFEPLRDGIIDSLPPEPAERPDDDAPRLAIIGRPNVGKSSLLNRLLGEDRALVSPIPGTTRDPIDTRLEVDGETWLLVDTAGIRRRSRTSGVPEALAVMMARRQAERADVALLVVDAADGVTSGDLVIAGTVFDLGRSVVVVINKWDLLDDDKRRQLEDDFERLDQVLSGPRRVNISAKTARGINRIFPAVRETLAAHRTQLGTSAVNEMLAEAVRRHAPPAEQGRPWKFYYATQVSTGPPTFMLFANRTLPRAANYRRYLENFLRQRIGLGGVPARLVIRKR